MIDAVRELVQADRCDRCGAAAKVLATFKMGQLFFCSHHANEFSVKLQRDALKVYDPDNTLPQKSRPSFS